MRDSYHYGDHYAVTLLGTTNNNHITYQKLKLLFKYYMLLLLILLIQLIETSGWCLRLLNEIRLEVGELNKKKNTTIIYK